MFANRLLFTTFISHITLLLLPLPSHGVTTSERNALIDFYQQTNGDNWINTLTSQDVWEITNTASDPCTWHGISCNSNDNISEINLLNNNLTGVLANNLNTLTALETFTVANNSLSGTIPTLSGLNQLTYFDVSRNQLSGSIPALSSLTNLTFFYANHNQLSGTIPAINGLNLQYFNVNNNRLSGQLPSLTGQSALFDFRANDNQLSGVIPMLNEAPNLHYFYVNNNQLTGEIPSLDALTNLWQINLSDNQLSGNPPNAPDSLLAGGSKLCPNKLVSPSASDSEWDTATAESPWSANCQLAPPSKAPQAIPASNQWLMLIMVMVLSLLGLRLIYYRQQRF